MLIEIITHDAERRLLAAIEQAERQPALRGALHFPASRLPRRLQEEEALSMVRPLLQDKQAALYFCNDGDLIITWNGVQKAVLEDLCGRLYSLFQHDRNDVLHRYYDFNAHGEELRLLCKQKLQALPTQANVSAVIKEQALDLITPRPTTILNPTPEQTAVFKTLVQTRKARKRLEILVVEDQPFSNKLLVGLLDRICRTYSALNAQTALELYLTHAPDMVFLDIEMPDINGHELTTILRRLDPEAYIIIVTANHYVEDVARAKANGAKGFVAKPFSKQKILVHLEEYIHLYKLKPKRGSHERAS